MSVEVSIDEVTVDAKCQLVNITGVVSVDGMAMSETCQCVSHISGVCVSRCYVNLWRTSLDTMSVAVSIDEVSIDEKCQLVNITGVMSVYDMTLGETCQWVSHISGGYVHT